MTVFAATGVVAAGLWAAGATGAAGLVAAGCANTALGPRTSKAKAPKGKQDHERRPAFALRAFAITATIARLEALFRHNEFEVWGKCRAGKSRLYVACCARDLPDGMCRPQNLAGSFS